MTRMLSTIDRMLAAFTRGKKSRQVVSSLAITLLTLISWNALANRRRIWSPAEVPVAFWAWRSEATPESDVREAVRQTRASNLFIRAGQIDYEAGKLRRIRAVRGAIPTGIAIHFVYNATRSLLSELERINHTDAADAVFAAFTEDLDRAQGNQAQVVGLQLDFDVPTRLLGNYAAILRSVRSHLPKDLQLSITGLPTWLDSTALKDTLSACDLWVPQCYGSQIPERLDQQIPITSPQYVSRSISRTRDLGLPFYAGLAAYGYAIHYSRDGSLIGLRGDLDPLLVVASTDFEMIEQLPFFVDAQKKPAGEWRSVYRAQRDVMLDGTAVRAGEWLLLDRPTAAGFRACARKVREQAGERLLGICVFRIPSKGDATTMTLEEISSALSDVDSRFSLDARLRQLSLEGRDADTAVTFLEVRNTGATASRTGEGALTVLVRVPSGSLESVSGDDYAYAETVFESGGQVTRCALKRANAVRISTHWWHPGTKFTARLEIKGAASNDLSLRYAAVVDDGTRREGTRTLKIVGAP